MNNYNRICKCTECQIEYPVYRTRCDICHHLLRHRPRSRVCKEKYITGGRY